MTNTNRNELWSYIDASDVIEIVEGMVPEVSGDSFEEGYQEALDDILHAAKLDAMGVRITCTKEHIESWMGHVALNSSDDGYCTAVADVVESISQLISDRY